MIGLLTLSLSRLVSERNLEFLNKSSFLELYLECSTEKGLSVSLKLHCDGTLPSYFFNREDHCLGILRIFPCDGAAYSCFDRLLKSDACSLAVIRNYSERE